MPIICFFGPDGSGKTTLVKTLVNNLSEPRVIVSWMRGTHTFASLTAKFLSYFNTFKGNDNPYYKISIPRHFRRAWQLIEFFSIIPIILGKFIVPNLFNYRVIAERYAPDFVIWVSITTHDNSYPKKFEAKFLLALSSKAVIRIYLTATLEELLKRRKENSDTLETQIMLYDKLASDLQAYILDTTHSSASESMKKILNLKPLHE